MPDYTHEAVGTKFGKGEIQICPHCRKPALVEVTNGMRFFTHSATSTTRANGGARVEYVECPAEKITQTKPAQ
jgi:hypothetical protein